MSRSEQDMHHPLQPQSDGIVEWYIKMIKEYLRKIVMSHQRTGTQGYPPSSLPIAHPPMT
jgi:hypothetical protein